MSLGSDNAPVVHIKSGTKNIKVSRSILHGASVSDTDEKHSTIFIEGKVDSSEISSSTILNGSNGVLVKGESSNKMNTIVLDGLDLAGQSAVGISMLNQLYPVVNGCYIDNNRLEIVNSLSPYAGNNRIVINGSTPSTKGYGYSDKPYSGIGFINCSDTSIVNNNNVCIETNGFYGVHYKDCKQASNPNQKSVINNNSIQSYRSGIQIENSDLIIMNKTSVDYRGSRNDNNAALFIDSESSGIEISKMILNSSSAGWAVLLGKKDVLANSAVNNFHSTEQSYFGKVLDGNKNLDLKEWKSYFKFPGDQQNSFSVDPEFYEDCDLITCNITIKGNGYEECITGNPPAHIYPEKDQEGLASSSVLFEWQNIFDSHAYWLQVNQSEDFGGIIGKDDEVQAGNDLIIDEQDIKSPYFAMFGLEPNTTYYWRVRIYGQERRSKWSESQKFTTGNFTDVQMPAITKYYNAFVAPNPANQNSMLVFELNEGEEMRIGIYDLIGNNLGEIKYIAHQGRNIIPLGQINNNLSQGLYFINIRGNQNELLKFVAE